MLVYALTPEIATEFKRMIRAALAEREAEVNARWLAALDDVGRNDVTDEIRARMAGDW